MFSIVIMERFRVFLGVWIRIYMFSGYGRGSEGLGCKVVWGFMSFSPAWDKGLGLKVDGAGILVSRLVPPILGVGVLP